MGGARRKDEKEEEKLIMIMRCREWFCFLRREIPPDAESISLLRSVKLT